MIEIRRISISDPLYAQEVALREGVLLSPIGLTHKSFCEMFPGVEARFEHFVAVFNHPSGPRVVGCALLLPDSRDNGTSGPNDDGVGKLMQMAVDLQRHGEGIGTKLVVAIERRAFGELGYKELYCHARDTAYGFYQSLGWEFDSETFLEAAVPHRRMIFRPPTLEAEDDLDEA